MKKSVKVLIVGFHILIVLFDLLLTFDMLLNVGKDFYGRLPQSLYTIIIDSGIIYILSVGYNIILRLKFKHFYKAKFAFGEIFHFAVLIIMMIIYVLFGANAREWLTIIPWCLIAITDVVFLMILKKQNTNLHIRDQ